MPEFGVSPVGVAWRDPETSPFEVFLSFNLEANNEKTYVMVQIESVR